MTARQCLRSIHDYTLLFRVFFCKTCSKSPLYKCWHCRNFLRKLNFPLKSLCRYQYYDLTNSKHIHVLTNLNWLRQIWFKYSTESIATELGLQGIHISAEQYQEACCSKLMWSFCANINVALRKTHFTNQVASSIISMRQNAKKNARKKNTAKKKQLRITIHVHCSQTLHDKKDHCMFLKWTPNTVGFF